jgi:hypothetical protein
MAPTGLLNRGVSTAVTIGMERFTIPWFCEATAGTSLAATENVREHSTLVIAMLWDVGSCCCSN